MAYIFAYQKSHFGYKCWYSLFHDEYFLDVMAIWYSLLSFGIFSPVLVRCAKKNLATMEYM
jgi:hypothetical protein